MATVGVIFGHLVNPYTQEKAEYSPVDKKRVWRIVCGLRREDRNLESESVKTNANAEKSVET